jgi:hypothetical protein
MKHWVSAVPTVASHRWVASFMGKVRLTTPAGDSDQVQHQDTEHEAAGKQKIGVSLSLWT